jgi:hypothetical protein
MAKCDPELLLLTRNMPCAACGASPPNDPHHIKTKGSGGGDEPFNLISLCRRHHIEWHHYGAVRFLTRFPDLRYRLLKQGWVIEGGRMRFTLYSH